MQGAVGGDDQAKSRLIEVTVPVYNEEKVLAENVRRLHSYLTTNLPFRFVITIADNASTDQTFAIATRLCAELTGVRAVHLDRKGRGLALRHVWETSGADVGVHGRRPVHRAGRVPAADLPAGIRAQRPGDRQPPLR